MIKISNKVEINDKLREKVAQLYTIEGKNKKQICEELNITSYTLNKVIEKYKIEKYSIPSHEKITYVDKTDYEFIELERKLKIKSMVSRYGEENFFLSFSGGRDSTVLSYFLDLAVPNNQIPRIYMNTGIELTEVVKFVKKMAETDERIKIYSAGVNIPKMLKEVGYPVANKSNSEFWYAYKVKGDNSPHIKRWKREEPMIYKNDKYLKNDENSFYTCPHELMEITKPEWNDFLISDQCCDKLKKEPFKKIQKELNRPITITGMLAAEGGRRKNISCMAFEGRELVKFHPFAPCPNKFIDYLIDKYDIELCKLYYPPYNFKRTGCKGCPFSIKLKDDLETLEKFFPSERKQCEKIWEPVYDLYRKCNYRKMNDLPKLI